jgi:excinuclease UvrABC nuclease subunit
MPFTTQPRSFTQQDIESLNPRQRGVYGIYRPGTWIYIGKADDLRARMFQHISGTDGNPCILRERPTNWIAEVTNSPDLREQALILEFNPICNKRVG